MNRKAAVTVTLFLLVAVLVVGGVTLAKGKPKPGSGGCQWGDIQCPDIYDPVTCDNGVTYPNACYAFAACATGCSGGGSAI
jgi:hypothetical protein